MAYGKIKADAIIYDNSGSDVEKTVVSLTTPEGSAVKSTGESGTTKFLRVDGDGTCSWQVPPDTNTQLTLVDEDNMSSNSDTSVPSQQSVKAYVDAVVPTSITVADESSDTTCFPLFVTAATGDLAPKTGTNFTFNSSTGKVVIGGDLQVQGTTTTVDSTTMSVADKNIELAKGAANDAAADGGGITLVSGDGNKTITWNNAQDAWIYNQTITVETGVLNVKGPEGGSATLYLISDEGDDSADTWRLTASADNSLYFQNYTTGAYTTTLKLNPNGAVEDSKGDVRKIIQNTQGSAYTLVAADSGKHILASGAVTIPNNVFAAGDAVTIVNNTGGDIAITASVGALYNSADGSTGNRTLGTRGMATVLFGSATGAFISGAGLS